MKFHLLTVWLLLILVISISLNSALATDFVIEIDDALAPVSLETLDSRNKDLQANTTLDGQTKAKLLELYRQTTRNLNEVRSNNAASDAFIRSKKTDKEQTARIRQDIRKQQESAVFLGITARSRFAVMEQYLFTEKANLEAVEAKLSDVKLQLTLAAARPNQIRQRLSEAMDRQEDITAQLLQPKPDDEQPLLTEARRWMLETEQLTLRSEIRRKDQELLSRPMRIDLLKAYKARQALVAEHLKKRVATAQQLVDHRRQVEAKKDQATAEKVRRELEGKPQVVQQLAARNAALTDALTHLSSEFGRVTQRVDAAKKKNDRLMDEFRNVRKKLDVGGFEQALGQVLIEQQRQLPDLGLLRKSAAARAHRIAKVGLQQLQYSEEYKQLSSLSGYVGQFIVTQPEKEARHIRRDLKKLAVSRQHLLERLIDLSSSYLNSLSALEFSEQALFSTTQDYQHFLVQRSLWVRSGPILILANLREVPSQMARLIAPARWREVITALDSQAMRSPVLVLGLIVVAVLLWKAKSMHSARKATGANIGKVSKDSIVLTFHALGLTLLLAAPWPLLLGVLSWQLSISPQATDFTNVISQGLSWLATPFFGFGMLRVMYEPDGLAAAHFHVPESSARQLHRDVGRLMVIFLPSGFIYVVTNNFDLAIATGVVGRLCVAVVLIALAVFFYHITAPRQSLLHNSQTRYQDGKVARWHRLWRPAVVATPLVVAGFDLIGYSYAAAAQTMNMIDTLWLILVLIIIKQVAVRWLLLTQRRLAWHAAVEKRAAERAQREAESSGQQEIESESGDVEEPEIDFAALSQESRQLLHVALMLLGILGILLIWADMLPAISLLDDITLWSHTAVVSGEKQVIPVTLLDLGLAGLILFVTVVAAKYLPSLLEIIMLQRTALTAGSRYTVTTITNYIIVAIGMTLFFNRIGVDWSKVQWLIAAMGVGIGFGLQEIVANFISGIIILFERPIRVGDTVTIGDNDGIVVRIRIRATTIRNWDRKELLVPNKEFITGQLTNWTLSDSTIRIVIPVGLAYGGDVELALKIMLEAAEEHPDVLSNPMPSVVFDEFGDNALSLKLRCFIGDPDCRMPMITALHKVINRKFNDAGLVIAFPQRDVHLDTNAPLEIRIRRDEQPT